MSGRTAAWRHALLAGCVTAVSAFPLSMGFALMAGVPPGAMVLASLYGGLANALFGGRYGVGGPNTAVALLTGAAVMPFAPPESDLYMGYVFTLCVLVGIYQLGFAVILRRVDLMDYVSTTVIDGITWGIGVLFILGSLWLAAGLAQPGGAQWPVFHALMVIDRIVDGTAQRAALEVSAVTLLVGLVAGRVPRLRRANILIGLAAGCAWAASLPESALLERVGWVAPIPFQASLPDFRQVSWPVIFALAGGPALAIALVGALQSLGIAKALRDADEPYRPAREMLGQAVSNLWCGFFMGTPGSNSFNKSSVMHALGGGGGLAHLFAVAATAALIYGFTDLLARMPMSALGAALILAGLAMIAPRRYARHFRRGRVGAGMFVLPALLVVILDIQSALFIGVGVSILAHFVHFSRGTIAWDLDEGRLRVAISGVFFFVSGARLENRVRAVFAETGGNGKAESLELDLRPAHLVTLDQLDLAWLRHIVRAGIPVCILILAEQREAARGLLDDAGLAGAGSDLLVVAAAGDQDAWPAACES